MLANEEFKDTTIVIEMAFLGATKKQSKTTSKQYYIVQMQDVASDHIHNFYLADSNKELQTELTGVGRWNKCKAHLKLTSFNGQSKLDLVKVSKK